MAESSFIETYAITGPKKPNRGISLDPLIRLLRFNIGGHEDALKNPNLSHRDRTTLMLRLGVMITLLGLLGGCADLVLRGEDSLVGQWYHGDLLPD